MKTDIQIAQSAKMKPIVDVAKDIGLTEEDLLLFGKYKAKVELDSIKRRQNDNRSKTSY